MTTRTHAVFLRNNRTPRMAPLREALDGLGFGAVAGLGSSGNFVFRAPGADSDVLGRRVTEALGAQALVRTREELAAIVTSDPFASGQRACQAARASSISSASSRSLAPCALRGSSVVCCS